MKKFLQTVSAFLIFAATASSPLFAQFPGCPEVNAGSDVILPCGQTCTTLTATAFSAAQTTSYTVGQISYSPPFGFNGGTSILVGTDDVWSSAIALPFNFCFFGTSYNQIIVGSNGVVSFNTANAGQTNNWQITGPIPNVPNNNSNFPDLENCIMGPWQDMDPTNQGAIHYQILGTAPCRTFEVSWYQVPYYGDPNSVSPTDYCSAQYATQQIVLYETTNAIDVYIQNKGECWDGSGWNGGLAIEGIQNAAGTVAYTVPGRNATQWTASNDAWRFTPAGPSNTTIAWFDGATQIGTGSSIQVCPASSRSYTAQATYTNCDNSTVTVSDNVYVGISGISINIDSLRNPTCHGGNNGAAYASFSSTGSAVLSYRWTPGGAQNSAVLTGVGAGTYIFSVTDATNCTKYDTVTLTDPPALTVSVPDSNAYSCVPGNISGALTAYPSGGTAGYTYLWAGSGATSQSVNGLQAGSYVVTVTDAHNCTALGQGQVVANVAPPIFDPPIISNVSCNGANDGSITANLIHSTPPINYTWSNGLPPGATVTGLAPGPYYVTGTDVNGCSATTTYTVTQPNVLTIGSPTITQQTCLVGGTISVTPSGGTTPYYYHWSNADSTSVIDSLAAGSYNLTVTDTNGCSASASYSVTAAADVINLGTPSITNISCNGRSDGSITAVSVGGSGTITYTWNPAATGATISNLTAGNYSVTVTSGNPDCSASAAYTITEPSAIVIGTPNISQATCNTGGSIFAVASGGTPALVFTWSNNKTGPSIDSLAAGPYILTVTDQNGCSVSASYTVTADPTVVTFGTPSITNETCYGSSNGSITATASGGTGPITFVWSQPPQAGATINGLPAGTYHVTISDSVGCSASTSYTITQPDSIMPTLSYQPVICLDSTGTATVNATGGTPGYTYLWAGSGATTQTADNLFPGTIGVTVTDAAGCSASATGNIQTAPDIQLTSVVRPFPCVDPPYGNDTIVVTTGDGPFTYSIVGVGTNSTGIFDTLSPATYTFIVTDTHGCSKSSFFVIPASAADDQYNVAADSVTCYGHQDGSITITPLSGNSPYSYSFNGGSFQSDSSFTGLGIGNYSIVAQNEYGCTVSLSADIEQPEQGSVNANPDTIVTAPNVENAVTAAVQNISNPVYTWSPSVTCVSGNCDSATLSATTATVFYVTAYDSVHSACTVTDSVVVIVSSGFVMPNAFTPNGDGRNDLFGPVSFGPITVKAFRIYNRWGELVHNAPEGWDGKLNGKEQPAGTFVYYVEVEYPDSAHPGTNKTDEKQGSFALVR